MKRFVAVVGTLLAVATTVWAQDARDPQTRDPQTSALATMITRAHGRGCTGHAGVQTPLRWSAELARAAQRVRQGDEPLTAVEKEDFRVTRVFTAKISGARQAGDAADVLSRHYCEAVTDAQFTDFGADRQGSSWVVLFAVQLQLSQLDDARAVAAKVLALTNEARAQARQCGSETFQPAPPLRFNVRLERAAAAHAQDMATKRYVEHVAPDGSTPAQRISHAGYSWQSIGENVAAGQRSAEIVVQDWLASPGHCANIMSDDFTDMGVAFSVNMKAGPVVYWAQEFGRTK